jgi:hypothetical protein
MCWLRATYSSGKTIRSALLTANWRGCEGRCTVTGKVLATAPQFCGLKILRDGIRGGTDLCCSVRIAPRFKRRGEPRRRFRLRHSSIVRQFRPASSLPAKTPVSQ